jgi:hypothetical protein
MGKPLPTRTAEGAAPRGRRALAGELLSLRAGPAGSGPAFLGGVGVRAVAVGLVIEESREEIAAAWKRSLQAELGGGEAAIGYAVAPLLREMALALRGDAAPLRGGPDGLFRCAVLVRSNAQPGRIAREFKLLHRAVWEVLRRGGHGFTPEERRAADEWLDEALAASLDRSERVRLRLDLLERGPVVVPPAPAAGRAQPAPAAPSLRAEIVHPPPLPARAAPLRPRASPPPLPRPAVVDGRANGSFPHGE